MQGRTAEGATGSNTEDQGAGLDGAVLGGAAGGATSSDTEDEEMVIIVEDMGAGLVVIGEDEGEELIYEVEDETAALDDTVELVEQGGSSAAPPIPKQSQGREGTGTGARKRVASDSSSTNSASSNSSASSRSSNSIRGEHERLNPRTVTIKRKRRSWREGEPLERHRHHSLIGIRHPRIGDQGANDPLADQDEERGEEQDDTATQDEERDDDQDANDPRRDIQGRLRRATNVIISDTYANRPQRARPDIDRYQAGAKKATKRLQRGRGRVDVISAASTVDVYT